MYTNNYDKDFNIIKTANENEEEANKIDNCLAPTNQERIAKLEEEKSILAENVYQLASIIETMLGDVNNG